MKFSLINFVNNTKDALLNQIKFHFITKIIPTVTIIGFINYIYKYRLYEVWGISNSRLTFTKKEGTLYQFISFY